MKRTVLTTLLGGALLFGIAYAQGAPGITRVPHAAQHERMNTGMEHMSERGMMEMMQHCQRMMDPQR